MVSIKIGYSGNQSFIAAPQARNRFTRHAAAAMPGPGITRSGDPCRIRQSTAAGGRSTVHAPAGRRHTAVRGTPRCARTHTSDGAAGRGQQMDRQQQHERPQQHQQPQQLLRDECPRPPSRRSALRLVAAAALAVTLGGGGGGASGGGGILAPPPARAEAAILVGPPEAGGKFETIMAAVEAAAPGGVVTVLPGRYEEQVVVEGKFLTLQATQVCVCGGGGFRARGGGKWGSGAEGGAPGDGRAGGRADRAGASSAACGGRCVAAHRTGHQAGPPALPTLRRRAGGAGGVRGWAAGSPWASRPAGRRIAALPHLLPPHPPHTPACFLPHPTPGQGCGGRLGEQPPL